MDIWMIWARDGSDSSGTLWLAEAWDSESIDGNGGGWAQAIQRVEAEVGGANMRIAKTTVNFEKIQAAFDAVDI